MSFVDGSSVRGLGHSRRLPPISPAHGLHFARDRPVLLLGGQNGPHPPFSLIAFATSPTILRPVLQLAWSLLGTVPIARGEPPQLNEMHDNRPTDHADDGGRADLQQFSPSTRQLWFPRKKLGDVVLFVDQVPPVIIGIWLERHPCRIG